MTEDFLQYIWGQRLYRNPAFVTTGGSELLVLNPGRANHDAGPDFFNAQIKLGTLTWAGNVEIHQTTDDWYRHGHDADPAYDNVILHVVGRTTGREVRNSRGEVISEVVLEFAPALYDNYLALLAASKNLPIRCADKLASLPSVTKRAWVEALLVERLEAKSQRAEALFAEFKGDMDQAFFCLMARALGGKVNAEPMEALARQTPLKVILKHNSELQTEALLLGQAGLLPSDGSATGYVAEMCREYDFLKSKFSLEPMSPMWKYARMRPPSFPDIRIAQLAALVRAIPGNFASCLSQSLDKLFDVSPSDFWRNRYRVTKTSSAESDKRLGSTTRRLLTINAVVPFLVATAKRFANEERLEAAVALLRELPIESNSVLDKWESVGLAPVDEGDAQALLHLTSNYCERGLCLHCRFGHAIVSCAK